MSPWMNAPSATSPWMYAPGAEHMPCYRKDVPPMQAGASTYPIMYPEIYYRIHPVVCRVCEEMDDLRMPMPTQEAVEAMVDRAHDEVCRLYPDIAEYARECEKNAKESGTDIGIQQIYGGYGYPYPYVGIPYGYGGFGGYGFRSRRRGLLRDLISIVLISQLFRRRRFGY